MTEQIVRWPIPPQDGYTVDDLLTLDLPAHTELIDGGLVFMSAQRSYHGLILYVLERYFREHAPTEFAVAREMMVGLTTGTALEPDLMIIHAERDIEPDDAIYPAEAVVLAIEVSSPSSLERDRDTKPHKYAGAGIRYYWRIERKDAGRLVAYTYELDDDLGRYRPTGTYLNRVRTDIPFAIDVDLSETERL